MTWTITLYADTALEAAQAARDIQLDSESLATVFDVAGTETIDLENEGSR